jgi:hypothetical protein
MEASLRTLAFALSEVTLVSPAINAKDNMRFVSGRGVLPRWMREEMKGTKLSREDFRISTQ